MTHEQAIRKFLDYFRVDFRLHNLELLAEVQKKFTRIPYENVTKIIKSYEHPDQEARYRFPEEIIDDHIQFAAGGTCFSLVYYLRKILDELEFSCSTHMADMHYGSDIHCAIVTEICGVKYLVDPGYLLTTPIQLSDNQPVIHETSSNIIEVVPAETGYNVFTIEQGRRKWRYRIKSTPVTDDEFTCHWDASFGYNMMNALLISRADEDGRLYFRKNRFSRINKSGKKNENVTGLEEEFAAQVFGMDKTLVRKALNILKQKRETRNHGQPAIT